MPENVYEIRITGDANELARAASQATDAIQKIGTATEKTEKSTTLYEGTTRGLMRSIRLAVYQLSGELNPALATTVFALDRAALSAQLTGGRLGAMAAGATIVGTALAMLFKHINELRKEEEALAVATRSLEMGGLISAAKTVEQKMFLITRAHQQMLEQWKKDEESSAGGREMAWAQGGISAGQSLTDERAMARYNAQLAEIAKRWKDAYDVAKTLKSVLPYEDRTEADNLKDTNEAWKFGLTLALKTAESQNTIRGILQQRLSIEAEILNLESQSEATVTAAAKKKKEALDRSLESFRALAKAQEELDPFNAKRIQESVAAQERLVAAQKKQIDLTTYAAQREERIRQFQMRKEEDTPFGRGLLTAPFDEDAQRRVIADMTNYYRITEMEIQAGEQTVAATIMTAMQGRTDAFENAYRLMAEKITVTKEGLREALSTPFTQNDLAKFNEQIESGINALLAKEGLLSETRRELLIAHGSQQRLLQERIRTAEARAATGTLEEQGMGGVQLGFLRLRQQAGTFGENIADLMQGIGSSMTRGLDDSFFNVVTGRLRGLADAFRQVGYAIVREMTSVSAKMATRGLFGEAGGGGGLLGSLFGKIGGLFGGGGAGMMSVAPEALMLFQHGGIVTRPTLAMLGEGGESEAVIPLSKLGKESGGGVTVINVSDRDQLATIVGQEMAKGREVIVNDVIGSLRGNSPLRRGVQRFGR